MYKALNTLSIETNAGLLNAEVDLSDRKAPKYIFDSPKLFWNQPHIQSTMSSKV